LHKASYINNQYVVTILDFIVTQTVYGQDGLGSRTGSTGRTVEAGSDFLEYEYFPQLASKTLIPASGCGCGFIVHHHSYSVPTHVHTAPTHNCTPAEQDRLADSNVNPRLAGPK